MIARIWALSCLVVVVLVSRSAAAAPINVSALEKERPNIVLLETGAEYAFLVRAGYARRFDVLNRPLIVGAELTVPWAGFDFADYQVRVRTTMPLVGDGHFKLVGQLSPTLRGISNETVRMTSLGIDVGLLGGYYGTHFFVLGELGFDWATTTYVHHKDRYRELVYAEAKDGWYAPGGGNFRVGLVAGYSGKNFDLWLRGGISRDIEMRQTLLPFFATLGGSYRF